MASDKENDENETVIFPGTNAHSPKIYEPPLSDREHRHAVRNMYASIPIPFHAFVAQLAWQLGHTASPDDYVAIVKDIVDLLSPSIDLFEKEVETLTICRIMREKIRENN